MPTALFQKELNDVMYSKFNKGVYGTGKKIVDRMTIIAYNGIVPLN